jgi:guanyl-specific ribonuclease Sa
MNKYTLKRIKVRFRKIGRIFNGYDTSTNVKTLTEVQLMAIDVIKRITIKKDAVLLIDPIHGGNYIHYNDYFIKFGESFATITNGKFSYYIEWDYKTGGSVIAFFNRIVGLRRLEMEKQYTVNTLKSLNEMLSNINNIDGKHNTTKI